jgi:hypothetical protein
VHNTLVALWTGDPTLRQLERFWGELDGLARRQPDGIYVLNVITATTGLPDSHARQLLRLQFETMRGRVLALANVLEQSGVLAALSRTVLSKVLVLSRRPFPMTIHGDVGKGAHWLSRHERAPVAAKLVEVASTLRRKAVG